MKKFIITSVLLAMFVTCTTIMAQDQQEEYLGLPGDNLNLYAVMKLFRESETLEGFERSLNDENSRINNLDLNGDNIVDYISVIDYIDGDAHTIVLQVSVNKRENQDVAVFTVQRYTNGQVQVQLTGDEALYGRDYIIEPIFDETNPGQTPNPGYIGNTGRNNGRNVEIVNWPLVRFIFLPSYVPWHSSWYWDYYPSYWHSWQPYYWHYYYGYHYNWYNDYYRNYRRWNYHRYTRWNDFYYSDRRSHSPNVSVRIQAGNYKTTYSHPDQRREGEAMYAKMHPEQNRRSSDNSSGNTVRRSGSQSNQERKSTGTSNNTTRRSNTAATNKSVTNPSSGQNAGTARRSNTTVTNKSVTNPPSGQNAGTTRRSNTTVTNKSVTNPSSGQNAGTTRRSTATVTNKSVSNQPSGRNAGINRTSGKSTTTGVSSSSRRSSGSSKSGTTVNKGGKTK
ncbi:MAG: hypothetical protein WCG82_10515, partial [Bacteroidota bacterium]